MVKLWWVWGIRQFPENQKQGKYLFHNSIGTWTHGYFTWKLDLLSFGLDWQEKGWCMKCFSSRNSDLILMSRRSPYCETLCLACRFNFCSFASFSALITFALPSIYSPWFLSFFWLSNDVLSNIERSSTFLPFFAFYNSFWKWVFANFYCKCFF